MHRYGAAEVIAERSDAAKPKMGLMTWKNAPGGPIRKGDVSIAKNYLDSGELEALNRIVSAYLEFAELQANGKRPMHMADWIGKLDDFLKLSDRDILDHAGSISQEVAKLKAEGEFRTYRITQAELPQPVDRDFADALDEVEKMKPTAKKKSEE